MAGHSRTNHRPCVYVKLRSIYALSSILSTHFFNLLSFLLNLPHMNYFFFDPKTFMKIQVIDFNSPRKWTRKERKALTMAHGRHAFLRITRLVAKAAKMRRSKADLNITKHGERKIGWNTNGIVINIQVCCCLWVSWCVCVNDWGLTSKTWMKQKQIID